MCCSLSLCETCQTYLLRVQIWVWNLQLPPVLLLCPCIWGPNWTGWELGHPSRRGCLNLGRNSNSTNCSQNYLENPEKYIEAFTGLTLLYDLTCKDVMYVLGQMLNPDSKLKFWGSYYFWRSMAWAWNNGKEGTRNSPPSYWEPSGSNNRVALPDVYLRDLSKCTLRF